MENHVILCGLGRVGWHVLEFLQAAGTPVVAIDTRCAPADPRLGAVTLIQGDCQLQPMLEKAGVRKARGVVIVLSDELAGVSTMLQVRRLNPDVRIVVRMFNQNLVARLSSQIRNVVALSTSGLAAPLLALIARTGAALGTFRLDDGRLQQIAEVNVRDDSPLRGTVVGDLPKYRPLVILSHASGKASRLMHQVDFEATIEAGDRLVICGEAEAIAPLATDQREDSFQVVLWANIVRRLGRVFWRTLHEVDLPVKICATVLVTVIASSVLVFHLGLDNETLPDALYRTISLMATGSDMHGEEMPHGGWQKVFVSVLRVAGAALTAAFTAILTNYLVRARLGGALEIRRIPDSGHIIVCGLGNVGYRVVEELLRQGEKVVAIDESRDNPFVATARRQGVPVIIGDATVTVVLKQAHAATARAVVAATSMELVNLEIALLTRELNPLQRVVLLLVDPQLAQTVREAAAVRLALSIPALAAPAFVAALLGDRVRSVFMVAGKLLVVLDLTVAEGDPFLAGLPVRTLAVDYELWPISLTSADDRPRAEPLNARLGAGDRLTVIMALSDLQRLLRREPAPREWAVEVNQCPLPSRGWLVQIVRAHRSIAPDVPDEAVIAMPCRVAENLTRGQAEDLLFLLRRERVDGKLVRPSSS
jgi:Trk K+ transport system NAD-binding subunit